MGSTKIEWCDAVWNPVTGCSPISAGCTHCYAKRMSKRLAGRCGYPEAPRNFDVTLHPERLEEPLRWKKPRRVFVCSMGDLFHENVPLEFIGKVFATAIGGEQHVYQFLTKRPHRMLEFITWFQDKTQIYLRALRHVWLGVTAENQEAADERIPVLLQIPAAVRFVSVEPILGLVDLTTVRDGEWKSRPGWTPAQPMGTMNALEREMGHPCLDWVICGGETGPGARPMHPDWARDLRDQCQEAGVAFFFKQWGAFRYVDEERGYIIKVGKKAAGRLLDGREWNEMPR